jgi:hypothetical protein
VEAFQWVTTATIAGGIDQATTTQATTAVAADSRVT